MTHNQFYSRKCSYLNKKCLLSKCFQFRPGPSNGLLSGRTRQNEGQSNFSTLFSKAIPIKCFVSHRPTDPSFWKSKKRKNSESLVKKQVLQFTSTRSFVIVHVTKLSYLAARPSLALRTLHEFIFTFFCPPDRPTFTRGMAMGNETFYWDGLSCEVDDE